jgi:Cd2+/Zn2+-exporting ATPase
MNSLGITPAAAPRKGAVVHVARDGVYLGSIIVSDTLKDTACAAVAALKSAGVERTVMLTGDRREAAEATAAELGLDEVYHSLLPEDKVSCLQSLKDEGVVLFVGDGINDAPVLATADVGIAMGALGSDAAIESADLVIMDDDPLKVAKAVRISKKVMRIVRQNIVFALSVKGVCLILGALGVAGMPLAVFADVGVMVLAVLNALRAMKVKNI